MSIAEKKAEQIKNYYLFHKKIELIFTEGFIPFFEYNVKGFISKFFNPENINIVQNFYIINNDWINNWKLYSNYSYAKKKLDDIDYCQGEDYLKEEMDRICNKMIVDGKINSSEDKKPPQMINEFCGKTYFSKLILTLDNFDSLVDDNTYKLFQKFSSSFLDNSNTKIIRGLILDKMIIFFCEDKHLMKFIFRGKEGIEQFIINFNNTLGEKAFNDFNLANDEGIKFGKFKLRIQNIKSFDDSEKLINEFVNASFDEKEGKAYFFTETGEIFYSLKKCNCKNLLKHDSQDENLKIDNEQSVVRLVGLENIGATCYMNATLQCLININLLTKYLLNESNYKTIMNNSYLYELTSCYCEVLFNVYTKNIKNYKPEKFKQIINIKNPLFERIQANDPKNLINFLLEEMNNELKQLELGNNNNINYNFSLFNADHTNRFQILNNYINFIKKRNKSIISKIFCILIENELKCQNCSRIEYAYQTVYFLDFPLEAIYEFYNKNNINTNFQAENKKNKIIIPIDACFQHYSESKIFSGENQIYCNFCKTQVNGIFLNRIYSLSPIIILILNRGRENVFDCDVDFPQILNLEKYTQNKTNYNYKLKGVITRLGTNDFGENFLAYCRHSIDDKWYCYNDAAVTLCQDQKNGFKKGVPYILFYESINGDKNLVFEDNDNKNSNQNYLNCINNLNQNMAYGNSNNSFGINFMNMNNYNNLIINKNNLINEFNINNMNNMNNNMNNINCMNNIKNMNNMFN